MVAIYQTCEIKNNKEVLYKRRGNILAGVTPSFVLSGAQKVHSPILPLSPTYLQLQYVASPDDYGLISMPVLLKAT
jgi:hypothetical protein